jgi:hypothetical protein
MTGYELGDLGERYVAMLFHRAGLRVERAGPADLLVEGVPVEVKAARPGGYCGDERRGFQFCLRRETRRGKIKTDARRADLVVLLCYYHDERDPAAFVIPTDRLGDRHKVVISNPRPWAYAGRWAHYYEAWERAAPILENAPARPG